MANRGYEGEIAYCVEEESNGNNTKCFENCNECYSKKHINNDKIASQWKTLKGKFFMVSGANISCACSRSPNGIAPYSHLGDGNLRLVVVHHTSILNNLRMLLRLSKGNDVEDLSFVETHRAREFCFRAINRHSKWNCDGEVQTKTDIRAKYNKFI